MRAVVISVLRILTFGRYSFCRAASAVRVVAAAVCLCGVSCGAAAQPVAATGMHAMAGGESGSGGFAKKPVTGTIDTSKLHQEIAGFGASEAYYQGFLAKHPHSAEIYDALFGPVNGLHTDFLRLQNSFRYAPNLDFVTDTLDIVKHANALRTSPMTIVMSSWSPPAVLKSNGSEKNGGTLIKKNGKYDYADFAQYWQDSVVIYRKLGIDPTYVSIQNEPDETTDYESCRFNPTEGIWKGDAYAGYPEAVDAVYKAFQKLPNPPRLLGPETIGIGYGAFEDYNNALNLQEIAATTHHLYTGGDKENSDSFVPTLNAVKQETPGRLRFMTEYYTAKGFETAVMIQDELLVEEVNLYLEWPYAWPTTDDSALIMVENPSDQSKWKTKDGWAFTDSYYAMKQFSYFIHAGYHRVETDTNSGDVKITAFVSPKKDKLVVVAVNLSAKEANSVKLKLGDFDHAASSVLFRTTFPTTTEKFANLGPLGADDVVNLPAHSVATVEMTK
jgi:glucuronoarabinoxylan endo-1,4-beta-xylanase